MRIAIGADHAGFELKRRLIIVLRRLGHDVDDRGTHNDDAVDYPPICAEVARAVADGIADRGIVVGGSGQGEQMTANKIPGIRAALCNDLYTGRMSRAHNDANVLAIGGVSSPLRSPKRSSRCGSARHSKAAGISTASIKSRR
jgi:ribose 5-phosphate isomerase B